MFIYVYSVIVFYFTYTVSYMYCGFTVHCNSSSINQQYAAKHVLWEAAHQEKADHVAISDCAISIKSSILTSILEVLLFKIEIKYVQGNLTSTSASCSDLVASSYFVLTNKFERFDPLQMFFYSTYRLYIIFGEV